MEGSNFFSEFTFRRKAYCLLCINASICEALYDRRGHKKISLIYGNVIIKKIDKQHCVTKSRDRYYSGRITRLCSMEKVKVLYICCRNIKTYFKSTESNHYWQILSSLKHDISSYVRLSRKALWYCFTNTTNMSRRLGTHMK